MAMTVTSKNTTPHSILYLVEEAGTAAAEKAQDIISDLAAGPLKDKLNVTVADAAAARALIESGDIRISVWKRAGSSGDPVDLAIDCDDDEDSGFELNLIAVKQTDADTAEFYLLIEFRHSLIS